MGGYGETGVASGHHALTVTGAGECHMLDTVQNSNQANGRIANSWVCMPRYFTFPRRGGYSAIKNNATKGHSPDGASAFKGRSTVGCAASISWSNKRGRVVLRVAGAGNTVRGI